MNRDEAPDETSTLYDEDWLGTAVGGACKVDVISDAGDWLGKTAVGVASDENRNSDVID